MRKDERAAPDHDGPQRTILVTGIEHVIPKQAFQSDELRRRGIRTIYYTPDVTDHTARTQEKIPLEFHTAPANPWRHVARYFSLLRHHRPDHVELYFATKAHIRLAYVVLARAYRIPVVCVCRGNEIFGWVKHRRVRRWIDHVVYRLARLIIYTEYKMDEFMITHRIADAAKLVFFHNRTRVHPDCLVQRDRRLILYLNTFKRQRHPELVVQAAPAVLERFPDAEFYLVGKAGDTFLQPVRPFEQSVERLIAELGLEGRVRALSFTDDPWRYYEQAMVFVLPADMVFCNFALLEAMERAVPPVVADVPGAELVVQDGANGFRVPQHPEAVSRALIRLLSDESLRQRMGLAAREMVRQRFNMEQGAADLAKIYKQRVWNRAVK